jgi:perosamine synthetase
MTSSDPLNQIITAIRSVTGDGEHHLHVPDLNDDDRSSVASCFDEGFVSSVGHKIVEFEQQIAAYTGAKHVIAVSSGTAALHIALITAGIKVDDEVLVPALTFAASGHAIHYCGAWAHFVESSTNGFGVDPEALEDYLRRVVIFNEMGAAVNKTNGRIIRAIMVVHIFGHIGDIDAIKGVASRFNLTLVEDAAEALGSWSGLTHAGLHGKVGALSFNGNKIITTGGGGCLVTNDGHIAERARHISTTAKTQHPYDYYHDQVGYNYRMPNLNAALGVSQMNRLAQFLQEKIILRNAYQKAFSKMGVCKFYTHDDKSISNYWLQAITLFEDELCRRNEIIEGLHKQGLLVRPIWRLLNSLPAFMGCASMDTPIANSYVNRTINIPSSCYLGRHHG